VAQAPGTKVAASLASVPFETAIQQWRRGDRRVRESPPERVRLLERVVEELVAELRRRLGGRFSTEELVALYDSGASWTLQTAMRVAPDDPWAWEAGLVVDAAFARYVREAADFAGGRREVEA
jgi:hypothetical protein